MQNMVILQRNFSFKQFFIKRMCICFVCIHIQGQSRKKILSLVWSRLFGGMLPDSIRSQRLIPVNNFVISLRIYIKIHKATTACVLYA